MKKIISLILILLLLILAISYLLKLGNIAKSPEKGAGQVIKATGENAENLELVKIGEDEQAKEDSRIEETPTDWSTFHGDNARTGFSDSKAPSKPNVLWKWTFDDFMKLNYEGNFEGNWPIIDNDKVFIAPENIFALDLQTGEKIWVYAEEGSFFPRGLAAGNGKIFLSVNEGDNLQSLPPGYVYALDENTGTFLWKYQVQKGISHSLPLFADNLVFIGDDSGTVYALNAADGSLIWEKYLEDAEVVHSSPAYSKGRIFVGTEGSQKSNARPSRLYSLDAETGKELWRFQVDYISGKLNLVHSAPAVSEGVVYVGSENGYFYALSADKGELIWKNKIASGSGELIGVSSAAAVGYGKVFIGTYEGKFLALDQKDGKVKWEYSFGQVNADSSPVLADHKVYFGAGEGYFYSFNAETGDLIWKEKLGGSSGALANGILVVPNKLIEDNFKSDAPVIIAFSNEGKEALWK